MQGGATAQLGAGRSPELQKPREAVAGDRILMAATRCRRKVGRRAPRGTQSFSATGATVQTVQTNPHSRKGLILIQMRLPPHQ